MFPLVYLLLKMDNFKSMKLLNIFSIISLLNMRAKRVSKNDENYQIRENN